MWFSRPKKRRNFFRKAQVAPYRARRFQNPYFHQPDKQPGLLLAILGLCFGFIIALISFFFTSQFFAITSVRVEGAETINPAAIREIAEDYLDSRAFLLFRRNNRFLFNEKTCQQFLEKEYAFSSLNLTREGKTLAIVLKEKGSSFLWLTGQQSYLADNTGVITRSVQKEEVLSLMNPPFLQGPTPDGSLVDEPTIVLIFRDLDNAPVSINQSALSTAELSASRRFFDALRAASIYTEHFEINRLAGSWFKAITKDGYAILFEPAADVEKQAANVLLILQNQVKDPAELEYIDVRFGDRVFYK